CIWEAVSPPETEDTRAAACLAQSCNWSPTPANGSMPSGIFSPDPPESTATFSMRRVNRSESALACATNSPHSGSCSGTTRVSTRTTDATLPADTSTAPAWRTIEGRAWASSTTTASTWPNDFDPTTTGAPLEAWTASIEWFVTTTSASAACLRDAAGKHRSNNGQADPAHSAGETDTRAQSSADIACG